MAGPVFGEVRVWIIVAGDILGHRRNATCCSIFQCKISNMGGVRSSKRKGDIMLGLCSECNWILFVLGESENCGRCSTGCMSRVTTYSAHCTWNFTKNADQLWFLLRLECAIGWRAQDLITFKEVTGARYVVFSIDRGVRFWSGGCEMANWCLDNVQFMHHETSKKNQIVLRGSRRAACLFVVSLLLVNDLQTISLLLSGVGLQLFVGE